MTRLPAFAAVLVVASVASIALAAILAACRFTDGLSSGAPQDGDDGGPNACDGGPCEPLCPWYFADCDEAGSNGCEVDTRIASNHCGACGHDCLGGACLGGACQPILLAEGGMAPMHIVLDDASVYGVNATGTVTRISKNGGPLVTLVPGDGHSQSPPPRIALAGNALYYTDFGPPADGGTAGSVWATTTDGGKERIARANAPYAISVAGGYVYWSEGNPDASAPVGAIRRVNITSKDAGSGPALMVAPEPGGIQSIIATDKTLYWSNRGTPPLYDDGALKGCESIDADAGVPCSQEAPMAAPGALGLISDGNLYFTATDGLYAWACSLTSCSKRSVAPQQFDPRFLVFDSTRTSVFWTTGDGAIKTVTKAGYPNNNETILFQRRGTNPFDIAVDAKAVYWTDLAGVPGRPGTAPALYKLAR
ncbi:DUF5050 domain-containing protein [Pendulispora brunnea]|uniref:DUF5050 domain-containing protein n=1 Tax=Pendulispora brunnea TaxID=2905690 RepID=A0ABZ2JZB0_9BACT